MLTWRLPLIVSTRGTAEGRAGISKDSDSGHRRLCVLQSKTTRPSLTARMELDRPGSL